MRHAPCAMPYAEPIMMSLRLIFVSIVWGINFSFVKYALADFTPMSFTIVRFSLSTVFLMLVLRANGEPLAIDRQDRTAFIKLGLIGIALYNVFFMHGLKYTTASNSALFISTSPLFAFLLLVLSGKESFHVITGAGL